MLAQLDRTGARGPDLADRSWTVTGAVAAHTKVGVGYNVQVAVDAKNKLIVEQAVTNQVVDMGLLTETSSRPAKSWGSRRSTSSRIAATSRSKTSRPASRPAAALRCQAQRGSSVREGLFRKDEFRRRRARRLRLPGREVADVDPPRPDCAISKGPITATRKFAALASCARDARTTPAPFSALENEDVLDRMAERLKARPGDLDRRREVVEHPFGSIKQWMYQGAFLMRGLANVRAEFSLTALAYNLRCALNILGHDGRGSRLRRVTRLYRRALGS